MTRFYALTFVVGSLLLAGAQLTGCHGRTTRRPAASSNTLAARTVAAPLTSHVARGELLKGINSLEIAMPVLPSGISRSLSHEDARAMVTRTAREVLTLKLLDAQSAREISARRADGILKTEIVQYQDRQGSAIGGEPATVSLRMSVVSSSDNFVVWDAQYFYRQEPLTDNLLKLGDRLGTSGSGAGWISGPGLLQRGFTAALEDFNRRREQQFLAAAR